jgi:hypothetical protein
VMLFYITGGAPQAVPGTACVEANRTACIEDTCSSASIMLALQSITAENIDVGHVAMRLLNQAWRAPVLSGLGWRGP